MVVDRPRSSRTALRTLARAILMVFITGLVVADPGRPMASAGESPLEHPADVSPVIIVLRAHSDAFADLAPDAVGAHRRIVRSVPPPGLRITHRYRHFPVMAGVASEEARRMLAAHPDVAAVGPDAPLRTFAPAALGSSVPFVGADRLHRQGVRGDGIRVAVLDTGIDTNHLALRDSLVEERCFITPSSLCPEEPHVAEDVDGHGTHVAGIIASNGRQIDDGMAPDAELVAVKMIEERNNAAGAGLLASVDWLIESGSARVVNMSLGVDRLYEGVCDDADALTRGMAAAFRALRDRGVLAVAASGNDGSPNKLNAPACVSTVLAVGAIEDRPNVRDAQIATFTNRGPQLSMLAPGVQIESSDVGGRATLRSGTSMAAPHVSGAAALLMGEVPWAGPDLVERMLMEHGGPPTIRLGGRTIQTLRVDDALAALRRTEPSPSPSPTAAVATDPPPATATMTARPSSTGTASPTPTPTTAAPTREPPTGTPTASDPPHTPSATATSPPGVTDAPGRAAIFLPRLLH